MLSDECPCDTCHEWLPSQECGLLGPDSRCALWHEWDVWSRAFAAGRAAGAWEVYDWLEPMRLPVSAVYFKVRFLQERGIPRPEKGE